MFAISSASSPPSAAWSCASASGIAICGDSSEFAFAVVAVSFSFSFFFALAAVANDRMHLSSSCGAKIFFPCGQSPAMLVSSSTWYGTS